ncbi:Na(+)-translocating NADH-quinone reductase subunit A [Roseiconus nitratireducens]|uniref:Na(+)-translocating NADH-quinone reductase subunit A n=1 Tax=Roseiconus nitratireducens TaxID=2605748 RepID=A0A5M6DIQ3_9BACT|nr:Na(+)-translocating NADH-quinone reductase subunit A [Roseiconus nitratireducens]KAA5546069.1 Na(+)-translocating NADH-quinone reductase subunit A [Roseiconus nitratireducens]
MITIKEGLDLPILGNPAQHIEVAKPVSQVALLGDDYIGMKPTMLVSVGDRVKIGQPLFSDKKTEGVTYTSPAAGTVADVVRGKKRKFESIVIDVDPSPSDSDYESFEPGEVGAMDRQSAADLLIASGLWTSFRTRPYGKVPKPGSTPHSIFVQAIDTNPLAASPSVAMADRKDQFLVGLNVIAKLTDGTVHVCKASGAEIPGNGVEGVRVSEFSGPHPAGLVGTHIHELDPVGPTKTVWYIGYQDVIAIGALMLTGRLDVRRVISLAGPIIEKPRLLETRLGANIPQLIEGELNSDVKIRPISGSVLCGRTARDPHHFLGRYHTQISVIQEGDDREFLGWQKPGFDKYSITKVFASSMLPHQRFAFTTSTGGSERAMVPLGTYEKVMPLDILPTQLLRALIVRDTDQAQQLGALELEEEDLALCTFVCPGKYEYGSLLRENLTTIEREG